MSIIGRMEPNPPGSRPGAIESREAEPDGATAAESVASILRATPHRARLLQSMSRAVAEKGYAAVTIADVVAGAGVSKRTFYEHFQTKEDCLFACYAEASDRLVEIVRAAADAVPGGKPHERVAAAVNAYYEALDLSRPLTAALLTEIQASGAAGRALRRRKMHEFAAAIRELVVEGSAATGAPSSLDADMSIALCGGLYELVVCHAESSPDVPFSSLAPSATRFVHALLTIPA